MIKNGAIRVEQIKFRISKEEKELIENRVKELKLKNVSEYVRYCVDKEMGE